MHKGGNILLQWAPPKISVFKIDGYKIQYTTNDTWTNTPVYETAEVLEYVVKDAIAHTTYRFKICSCSHGIEGEELERLYSTDRKINIQHFIDSTSVFINIFHVINRFLISFNE